MKNTKQIGQFTKEADGRLSGHILFIGQPRKDGKTPVTHVFGHGSRINKLYTADQLQAQIKAVVEINPK